MSGLRGARVLVTRAVEDRGPLEDLLLARGAEPVPFPCIAFADAPGAARIADLLSASRPDWMVLASSHAVRQLWSLLTSLGLEPLQALSGVRLAAVGKGTAQALSDRGRNDAFIPREGAGAVALARSLGPLVARRAVLVPRAEGGNPALLELLADAGAHVEAITLYRTVEVTTPDPAGLAALREGRVDAIAFASGSAARAFVRLAGPEGAGNARVACMGLTCAADARAAGLHVDAVADGGFPELCDALDACLA